MQLNKVESFKCRLATELVQNCFKEKKLQARFSQFLKNVSLVRGYVGKVDSRMLG